MLALFTYLTINVGAYSLKIRQLMWVDTHILVYTINVSWQALNWATVCVCDRDPWKIS